MSAVPKKKLCWNCEGSVAKDIDNCPYCGVYVHAEEMEDNSSWNPSYRAAAEPDDVPSPLYQIKPEISSLNDHVSKHDRNKQNDQKSDSDEENSSSASFQGMSWSQLLVQLKRDIFPTLFLMMGSVFFLFGIVLLLFSQMILCF